MSQSSSLHCRVRKTEKSVLCGYTTQAMVIHKSAWLYDSSVSFCVGSLPRIPVGGYTSSPVVIRSYTSYTYHSLQVHLMDVNVVQTSLSRP